MERNWKKAAKIIAALILALVLLDAFCFWYYNPAEYDWDESRATDNIREPGAFTSRAKEGVAWTTIDANGYNNASVPGEDGVFVLMMGSSHVEGMNVMQDETVSSQLQQRLEAAGVDGFVYNIGISSHTLTRNVGNFERALDRFEPYGYVVLETQHVKHNKGEIEKAVNDLYTRIPATEPVIAEWISDQPLVRTLYRQWQSFIAGKDEESEEGGEDYEITEDMLDQYETALTEMLLEMKQVAETRGVEVVIFYHPHLLIQADGTAVSDADEGCRAAFTAACEAADVIFLDMTDTFLQAYAENGTLPHGFFNTAPGVGHLNAKGNAMIADALCELILEQEAAA